MPIWAILDALLVAAMNVGAQMDATIAFTPEKLVSQAGKVDVATLFWCMHLSYCVLCTSTLYATLYSLFMVKLAY